MTSNNISIQIPVEEIENVRAVLASLGIKTDNEIEEKKEEKIELYDSEDEEEIFEVKNILQHKIINGKHIFQIQWKDNAKDWVHDNNTNCEKLISEYRKKKGIKTVYNFCRVSTKNQVGVEHVSLDLQESKIKSFSEQKFGENCRNKIYKISLSAYKNVPKQLRIIGEACISGDWIFIWRVDRLSRNIVKYLSWLEELNNRGVNIYSVSENISYRENKTEFIQTILDAQKESELISKRIKSSIERRIERGDEYIGRLPYGKKYYRNKNGVLKVVVDKYQQQIIKIIKKMKSEKSTREIANYLNNNNIFKYKKKWNRVMIKRILEN